jgi:hypothetical protein
MKYKFVNLNVFYAGLFDHKLYSESQDIRIILINCNSVNILALHVPRLI